MKKFFVLLFLMAIVSISASARKSYITVWTYFSDGQANTNTSYEFDHGIKLSGDVPDNIEGFEYSTGGHYWYNRLSVRKYSTGEILNVLSEYGYEVEFVDNENKSFLLSKEISSGQTISKGDVNTDGEVNIADVNEVINIILGYVREHPEIMERYGK